MADPENCEPALESKPHTPSETRTSKTAAVPAKPRTLEIRTPAHPEPPGRVAEKQQGPLLPDSTASLLNRELTWLNFAYRVVSEADDPRTPLLERVKFLGIVGSTLDEFFMKRIGGLKQLVGAGMHDLSVDGRTPREQIRSAYAEIQNIEMRKQRSLAALATDLARHDIAIVPYARLNKREAETLRSYYFENIFPLVTPQAMDPAHPFPFVSNLSLNLLVTLRYPKDPTPLFARVKVPVGSGIARFLAIGNSHRFVALEDVMAHNLDLLFPGMVTQTCAPFRVTRNAHTEGDEDQADDLVAMIESELRERKFAPIVRLQVTADMSAAHKSMLAAKLGLEEARDVLEIKGMLGLRDLLEIAKIDYPELHYPPHRPVDHPLLVDATRSIFHQIRDAGALLVHHPYESFSSSVERFLREASVDPKVRAIKMTLYRTSADSKVVKHLTAAARHGKQVAVVVELKARFDEEANIHWAAHLEEAGIHVSYGVVGLKTHCKAILVVRQDFNRLRRYTHLGTGNYHAGNARSYTDFSFLTSDDKIGRDMTELFNYLTTGYKPGRKYAKILPAPKVLKHSLLSKIDREIEIHKSKGSGLIQFKCNALEDVAITAALYRASQAGVHIDLIVRDTCRLRPGIAGLSEHIRVVSIVGRFLEHARVYYFRNGGDEEYFVGSADLMTRNLESRVETVVPIEPPELRRDLRAMIKSQLSDNRCAWDMQSDGSYIKRTGDSPDCQHASIDRAENRHREATRLNRRRPKGTANPRVVR